MKGRFIEMYTPLEVFCCYAREDREMLVDLLKCLTPLQRQGRVTIWSDMDLPAGVAWERERDSHLESADIILLLVSPDFMSSNYCWVEMERAMERHNKGSANVIPILLRTTFFEDAPFVKLQMIPRGPIPITRWNDRDEAFFDIIRQINQVISELQTHRLTMDSLMSMIQLAWMKDQSSKASRTDQKILTAYKQAIFLDQNRAFVCQNKALQNSEITATSVKLYLDRLLGPDRRVKGVSYEFTTKMLYCLGFKYFYEIDAYIINYVGINDNKDLSTIAWLAKQGQIMKFETLLLASMGEDFINMYPAERISGFKEMYGRALRRLKRAGIDVGKGVLVGERSEPHCFPTASS